MNSEIKLYEQELCWLLEQMHDTLSHLTEQQRRWHPSHAGANSPATIANHVLKSTRVYVLGFGCRQLVSRNRSTEFLPSDTYASSSTSPLLQLADDIRIALAILQPEALDEHLVPPQDLWGEKVAVREITRREAFIISIRHAATHLGELRLTADLARQYAS